MAYRYPPAARWMHWLTAALVLALLVLGVWIAHFGPQDEGTKFLLYDIHESTGVALLVMVVLRLLRRLANPPAPLPRTVPKLFQFAAHANHALIYVVLMIQPVVGFLATNAWGFPVKWARLVPLPSPLGEDKALAPVLSDLHVYGAVLLVLLIGAHLCGVLYHGVIRRDGVVQRML